MSTVYLAVKPVTDDRKAKVDKDTLARRLCKIKENERYVSRLAGWRDAAPRVGAVMLLLDILEEMGIETGDIVLLRDELGKPYIKLLSSPDTPMPDFSISHCRNILAVAVAETQGAGRVGVDIETVDGKDASRLSKIADRYFGEEEKKKISRAIVDCNQNDACFKTEVLKIWTAREAISKYHGTGCPQNYDSTHIDADAQLYTYTTDRGDVITLCAVKDAEIIKIGF